jgi:prefoldin subunit 5
MTIDRDLIIFVLGTLLTVIGYVLHTARESIASLGARVGALEQSQAVTESRYDTLIKSLDDVKESEKSMAGVIADIYSMMNEIKVEMAKISARNEHESNQGRGR